MKKTFTKSGVISFLRLRAKIGTLASYKPIFLLEDEVKLFFKNFFRVIINADSENGIENFIGFHKMAQKL
jgi:hypothetical protein